jgi:hypothetical protein
LARAGAAVKYFKRNYDVMILLCFSHEVGQMQGTMKKNLLILAPVAMLALAACNKSETPTAEEAVTTAAPAAPIELPPSITSSGVFRCGDNTILYVDFLGKNVAADIRVGDKTATAVRVTAPKPEVPATPAAGTAPAAPAEPAAAALPEGPMKSADGETSLSGGGKQINVKLAGKGAQTCKA